MYFQGDEVLYYGPFKDLNGATLVVDVTIPEDESVVAHTVDDTGKVKEGFRLDPKNLRPKPPSKVREDV